MIKSLIHSFAVCPDMQRDYPKVSYGKGVYLYDEQGKQYLDASAGSCAVSNIGHGREDIKEVIQEQLDKVSVIPTHSFSNRIIETYLENLVNFPQGNYTKAWTAMSGTEAVENAVKLAFQYHRVKGNSSRYKIITRFFSYHGNSIFMLDIGGIQSRREMYRQWMKNFPHVSAAYTYRKDPSLTEEEYVDFLVNEFEETVLKEDPNAITAFVAEPLVGAALGAAVPPKGYFKRIKLICEKYDIVFIADEVLSGFGRTGENFGYEHFGFTPDILALGKGISGGYFPLSAVVASQKIADALVQANSTFLGGHTFACNPLGAAVGDKVLSIFHDEKLSENSKAMGRLLKQGMYKLAEKYEIIGDVRGLGLQCGIELVKNHVTKEPFPAELKLSRKIGDISLHNGVVLYPGGGSVDGVRGDHILVCPPLTVNASEIDEILSSLDYSLDKAMSTMTISQ